MKHLFFHTLFLWILHRYRPTNTVHADSPGVYTSEKILKFSTIDKNHLKSDVIDGSVVNGIRELLLVCFSFK